MMELTQRMECTQDFTGAQPATQVGFLGILGQIYAVNKGPNKIGRDACTCDIALDNVTLSRHHAVINVLSNQVVMLMDLGSANKTKLRGKNLPPYIPHPLSNGDTVQFGDALGIFRLLHDDTDLPMTQAIASPQATAAPRHAPNVLVPQSPEPSDEEDFLPASQSPFLRDTNPTSSLYTNLQRNTTPVQMNKDNEDSFLNEFDDVQKINNELNTADTQLLVENNIFTRDTQVPDIGQFDDHNFQKPSPKITTPRTYSRQNIHDINTQLHTFKKPSVYEAQTQIADLSDQEIHMSIIEAQTQIEQYNERETGMVNINEAQTQIGNINEAQTQMQNINELINELDSHLRTSNECYDKNTDETCLSANVSSSERNSDNEVILFSDVDACDSFIESQPIIPTDSGCEVTTPVKKCVMDSDLEISFEDMATQVIFNEEVNFDPQQDAIATDDCDVSEQATQIIPTSDIDFEDLATQVICNEKSPEKPAIKPDKCESLFKIPAIFSPKSDRKEPVKSEIDDRYYSCTQDVLEDLCTQKDDSNDTQNMETTVAPPNDFPKNSRDSEITNVIDNNFLEEEDSQTVFIAKLSKKGSEGTPTKKNILDLSVSDLPNSQEITKTLQQSYSKTVSDKDKMEEDEPKLDALSSIQPRVITRVRRPPARYDVAKNIFKAEMQPLVDAEIIEENVKRLKKCQSENDTDTQTPKKTKKHQRRNISLAHLQVQEDDDDIPMKNTSNRDKNKKAEKTIVSTERKRTSSTETKTNLSPETKKLARTETKTTTRTETKTTTRTETKTTASTEAKTATNTEAKSNTSTQAKATTNTEAKATTSTEPTATTSSEAKATTSSETKATTETVRKSSRSRQKRTDAKLTEHEKKHVEKDEKPKGRHRMEKKEPKKDSSKDQVQPTEKNSKHQEEKPTSTGMSTRAVSAKRQSEDIPSTSTSNVAISTDTDKNESVRTTRNKFKSEEQDKSGRRSRSKTTTEEKSQETPESSPAPLVDDVPGPSKRKASEPSCSSSAKRTRRGTSSHSTSLKGKATAPAPRVLFTAVPDEKIKNQLAQLGATLVQEVQSCTVIVTLQIKRTFKFLCGIGLGKPIVGLKWVQACIDTNSFVDPWRYLLKDPAAETRFKFSLRRTLLGKRDFLRGYNITSTPNVVLPPPEFKMIVECSGGAWQEGGSRWLAVSTPADRALWPTLAERGATVVSPELVLAGVLRQRLQIPQNIIYPKRASDKNKPATTRN